MLGMEIPRDLDDTNSDNSPSDSSDQNHTAKKLTAMPFGTEQARYVYSLVLKFDLQQRSLIKE